MKPLVLSLFLLAAAGTAFPATVACWTFNSPWPDDTTTTGVLDPAIGCGIATPLGEITSSYASGDTTGGHDPAGTQDNSAWSTSKYPAVTNANQTAGVRFDVSTAGYNQIIVTWRQRNSSTASRYVRLQYSLDGNVFINGPLITLTNSGVFVSCSADLAQISGAANNPSFAFQLVTEWQRTATGSGVEGYAATSTGSDYSSSGTIRFDVVTVTGTLLPGGNNPPVISAVPPQTLRVAHVSEWLPFTILDAEDPAASLLLSAESSNPAVVPPATIRFGGSGPNRTIAVTAGNEPGSAVVLIRVSDLGGKTATASFAVTVLPLNCDPVISQIPPTNVLANSAVTIPFEISDMESAPNLLKVQAFSSNHVLLPASGFTLGGTESNRWLIVRPAYGQAGVAPVALQVSDGAKTATTVFPVVVRPSTEVLLFDPFTYPDGSLTTNSAGLWVNRSGIEGQTQVANEQVPLLTSQTEDLSAILPGGPYAVSNRTVLYASFRLTLPVLPKKATGSFAHFGSGNTMVGRLYVSTTNAAPGFYRLLVSNGSGAPVELIKDLDTNASWQVVLRYDVDNAQTSFWINPRFDYDRDAWATDVITPTRVTWFGLRQGSDMGGDVVIDDVRVGLSFQAVTSTNVPAIPLKVTAHRDGSRMVLKWNSSSSILQYGYSPSGPFYDSPSTSPSTQDLSGVSRFFRLKP